MEAVMRHLRETFPESFFTGIAAHDYPSSASFSSLKNSAYAFVGGTNIMSSHWLWYHQWKLRLTDIGRAGSPILMGVGWHKYQRDPDWITSAIYRKLLHKNRLHSVRDRYSVEKLRKAGIANVIYTGCPTMWDLDEDHLSRVAVRRAPNVFFTLTAYLKNAESDREFVKQLAQQYDKLFFWPQMYDDLAYLRNISTVPVTVVEPSVAAARATLTGGNVDYIGMRLHCGVLVLQSGVRSLIVEVDNRATEIARDTKLPTVKRGNFDFISEWIGKPTPVHLDIPTDAINSWKQQFADTN